MRLPFLDPAFDARPSLFGLPTEVIVIAVAAALWLAGVLFLRRITHVDAEPRSFRATTRLESSDLVTRVVAAGLVGAAALAALLLLFRH